VGAIPRTVQNLSNQDGQPDFDELQTPGELLNRFKVIEPRLRIVQSTCGFGWRTPPG
jgi:hypothetical protein